MKIKYWEQKYNELGINFIFSTESRLCTGEMYKTYNQDVITFLDKEENIVHKSDFTFFKNGKEKILYKKYPVIYLLTKYKINFETFNNILRVLFLLTIVLIERNIYNLNQIQISMDSPIFINNIIIILLFLSIFIGIINRKLFYIYLKIKTIKMPKIFKIGFWLLALKLAWEIMPYLVEGTEKLINKI